MNSETGVSQDFSVFFLDYTEFNAAFETFTIAHDRGTEGYEIYWYDQESNSGVQEDFRIVPSSQSGDLYFTVHSYPLNSIPLTGSCFTADTQPSLTFSVSQYEGVANTVLETKTYTDNYPQPI